jgi:hypothetical protein
MKVRFTKEAIKEASKPMWHSKFKYPEYILSHKGWFELKEATLRPINSPCYWSIEYFELKSDKKWWQFWK